MLDARKKRESVHLINLIKKRSAGVPNFALLIGAGASASSGVKLSKDMREEWRTQLYNRSKKDESFKEWLRKQDWCDDEREYSILFEKIYDERAQRRTYIEECVEKASPSWGYIYLSNIIASNYINCVFTPNFDDLLNEACFVYAKCKPIVCAHDSAIVDVRITSARPKIIKLHGDYLYDDIKNTIKETDNLENNIRDKFIQFGREYGLIVIGYGGYDDSIMDVLNIMLRSNGYLPYGIYWCIKKGSNLSRKVQRLLQRDKVYFVEIEGFDEFMAELHEGLGLLLPDFVKDPYKATTVSLNNFIDPIYKKNRLDHPIIKKDAEVLMNKIREFESIISNRDIQEFDRLVPYKFLGDTYCNDYDYDKAIYHYKKALVQGDINYQVLYKMVISYFALENFDEAKNISNLAIKEYSDRYEVYDLKAKVLSDLNEFTESLESSEIAMSKTNDDKKLAVIYTTMSNTYLKMKEWDKAIETSQLSIELVDDIKNHSAKYLNKANALLNKGNEEDANEILHKIIDESQHKYFKACAYAMLKDKNNMMNYLEQALEDIYWKVAAKHDPDFYIFKDDDDFKKLIFNDDEN